MSTDTQNNVPVSSEPVYQLWSDEGFGGWTDTDQATYRWWLDSKNPPRMRKLYTAPVAAQPDVTQQTLDDVKAGIPARDAEIAALRKEIEALQAAQAQPTGLVKQLCDALELAKTCRGAMLMSDPPQEMWKARGVDRVISEALNAAQAEQPVSGDDRLLVQGDPWSGWACQYPGKLPRLYGDKAIAELNHHPTEGDRLFQLVEGAQQVADNAMERALTELVDKIEPGLDTGDLLADAARASKALDSAQQDADKVDAERLEFILLHTPGDALLDVVGELADTSDLDKFRAAIDAARKEPEQ